MKIEKLINRKNFTAKLEDVKLSEENGYDRVTHLFHSDEIYVLKVQDLRTPGNPRQIFLLVYFNAKMNQVMNVYVNEKFNLAVKRSNSKLKEYTDHRKDNFLTKNQLPFTSQIGADPEIFVVNEKDKIIPAFEFLPGKSDPLKTSFNGHANTTYWDGFQAEFTTAPNTCLAYHTDNCYGGLKSVYDSAKAHDKNAKLTIATVIDIPPHLIAGSAEEHVQFGCMPSFNAYGMKGEIADGREVFQRCAGGHIHFGTGEMTEEKAIPIVEALDMVLAVACVSLFAKYDDASRRRLYGLAGEYRLPKHGMEYRVLSNAWLMHPFVKHVVFDLARKVYSFGEGGFIDMWEATKEETIETINNCNVEQARVILKRNEKIFKKILFTKYLDTASVDYIYNMFMNGVESVIANPENIEGNWNLSTAKWSTHSGNKNACFVTAHQHFIVVGKKIG